MEGANQASCGKNYRTIPILQEEKSYSRRAIDISYAPGMDQVRSLILKEAENQGLTLAFLSKKMGRNHAYLQQFIHRNIPVKLPEDDRAKLSALLKLDEGKLGARRRHVVPAGEEFGPDIEDTAEPTTRTERRELGPGEIPERDIVGGLGAGGVAMEIVVDGKVVDNVRATWVVPVDYLHTELRSTEEADVDIIPVDGDSMVPTLMPGDRVMINRRQKAPSPDGLYAIHDGIGIVVKRIEVVLGSSPIKVLVKSDNPHHGAYEQLVEDIHVVGRVICRVTRM